MLLRRRPDCDHGRPKRPDRPVEERPTVTAHRDAPDRGQECALSRCGILRRHVRCRPLRDPVAVTSRSWSPRSARVVADELRSGRLDVADYQV